MKSGTLSHVKIRKLKLALKIPLWQAVGILESLWHFAADCADDGGVGRYPNDDIAAFMEWDGDPDELVGALVKCRWLDEDPVHRLSIHDWDVHRPNFVLDRINKRNYRLATKKDGTVNKQQGQSKDSPESDRTVQGQSEESQGQSYPSNPIQSNPIQSDPIQTTPGRTLRFDADDLQLAEWMFGLIRQLQPERKEPNLEAWANSIRLMREQDGRAPPDIRSLFEWCNRDSFWRTNVLSPDKLREKWDDLQLRRKSNGSKPSQQSAGKQFTPDAQCDFA